MRSASCREVIKGAERVLETYRKGEWRRLGATTPCGWDLLGVTVEGDAVVVIGVGVGTTGCTGDGAHGLDPIAVV